MTRAPGKVRSIMRDFAVVRWLRGRAMPLAAVALACALSVPALDAGFVADDLVHRKFVLDHLHGSAGEGTAWWNMFDVCGRKGPKEVFQRMSAGVLPWWTSRDLKIAFFRPLAVASHYLDFMLWPDSAWWMHLHSIALYAACVWLAAALYRRLLDARAVAGLAAIFYAIDEAHADGASWLADRNTVMTALFVLLTLLLFDRARRDGDRASRWLAPAVLLCAHASSEGAIAAWGYLGAYALFVDRAPWRERVRALAPLIGVTIAWIALSAALGFGVRGSGIYVDPRSHPIDFIVVTFERLPETLRAQFTIPLEIERTFAPGAQQLSVVATYALLGSIALCAIPLLRRSATARFFALGAIGSALPVCAGGAEPRLLFLVGFGAHGLIAELIGACVQAWPDLPALRRAAFAVVVGASLLLHGPVAAITAPLTPSIWVAIHRDLRKVAASLPTGPGYERHAVMILNTNYLLAAMFVALYRTTSNTPGPLLTHVLSASLTPVHVERVDLNAISIEPEGGFLVEPTSKLVRRPTDPFAVGEVVPLFGPRVTVLAVTADGRPERIRIDVFDMDDPHWIWMAWSDAQQRYERVTLPGLGESLVIAGSGATAPAVGRLE
jgi:hypothetical protein